MNRLIKFRIWDNKNKKFKIIPEENVGKRCAHICMSTEQDQFAVFIFNSTENRIFQQFTGLLDKEKKEIYEGDILSIQIEDDPEDLQWGLFKVFYDEGGFRVIDKYSEPICDYLLDGLLDGEVIGNIFENPELLKNE